MLTKDWKWNKDTMGTGVVAIDREHQILVSLLHRMHEAVEDGEGEKVIAGVLDELLEYTDWHFKSEEALFDKFDYPSADNH
ncbi:MAG: hemerythrin domain-containing protein [Planctomycetota bacterium]